MDVRILIGLALLSACNVDDRTHPVIPGGPSGPVGGGIGDAAVDDGGSSSDGGMLHGRVCLVTDLRDVTACASTGAGGLTVALGAKSVTTSANGSFSIAAPVASNLVWQVSGAPIQTSIAPFRAVSSIPVIATADFQELEGYNGVLPVAGEGSIVAHVVSVTPPNAPVVMATATTTPIGAYTAFYDGKSARQWTQSSTGDHGAIWIPGLPGGTIELTITPSTGVAKTISGLPVADRAITFVTVELSM